MSTRITEARDAKPQRVAKQKLKIDPQLVAKAREVRDRYLGQANDRLLIAPRGKYEVGRALAVTASATSQMLLAGG